MTALTVASCWFNAILDGLERQGLERTRLTLGVRGIVDGRFPDTSRIELSPTRTIWGRARLLSDDPLLGVKVGSALPIHATNVIAVITAHSPTFGESIQHLLRYQALLSEGGQLTTQSTGGAIRVLYKPNWDAVSMDVLHTDAIIACVVASGPKPTLVHLVGRPEADQASFAETLKCDVCFGARCASVDYDAKALNTLRSGADRSLCDINIAYAETLLGALRRMDALCQRVQAAVAKLGPGAANIDAVASEVGCSPRTLQRRLSSAGTSFSALFDAYRMAEALIMLSETDVGVSRIGHLLGFSESSSFSRAVSQWCGLSPRQIREQRNSDLAGIRDSHLSPHRPLPRTRNAVGATRMGVVKRPSSLLTV
ncbi:AraC family transcriptional regulator [Bradyrhizobium sp. 195]|uniref:AraC family transcriptional regulator n=1 Tax=Bradyrhizobium sp. 195 TaxID=2782662 RepID=UPI00200139E1|nr:AraC family transcriptional regulator [Bradyrhizobium sp. 195]UPK29115.1 AraC family transcriptional regulator [Bradyrhizobium sp. 195]